MKHFAPKERLVFPLDTPDWAGAEKLAGKLNGQVGWFKVGLELFTAEGPEVVGRLRALAPDVRIFLDLKLHDIPATVARAMKNLARLGADLTTVHAQGGLEMMRAAVEHAGGTGILAVTLLTSLAPRDLSELNDEARRPGALVDILAERALAAGCRGLVASGHEAAGLRRRFGPEPWLVIPGIRPSWSLVAGDDQARVSTPARAVADGADLLVIGRPIRDAADPAAAARRAVEEIACPA